MARIVKTGGAGSRGGSSRTGDRAFLDVEMIGDASAVYYMLRGLEASLGVSGMNMFFVGTLTPYLRQRAERRFAGEGDDVVGRWAPLKPATLSIRQSGIDSGDFFGISAAHPINVRTHDLEDYIVGGRGDIFHTGASSGVVYPQVRTPKRMKKKLETAQGGRLKPKTVARPVLGVNATDLFFTVSALAIHIATVTAGRTRLRP